LFNISDSRGTDAAGFWAASDNHVYYHKEPIRTSQMILDWRWQRIESFNPYLFLGHARAATQGNPKENKNNQPFVSENKETCLVHNGRVVEYEDLKPNYQLESDCDSEVLLRIFESTQQITDLLTLVSQGPSAGAIASIGNKSLWLFRNEGRPLWLIDLRETLGQIFFCSTLDIWLQVRQADLSEKIYPVLENEAWYFKLEENIIAKRFNISYD
jgi:glutamine phosphoribosylpyrophosphate amidotransferase